MRNIILVLVCLAAASAQEYKVELVSLAKKRAKIYLVDQGLSVNYMKDVEARFLRVMTVPLDLVYEKYISDKRPRSPEKLYLYSRVYKILEEKWFEYTFPGVDITDDIKEGFFKGAMDIALNNLEVVLASGELTAEDLPNPQGYILGLRIRDKYDFVGESEAPAAAAPQKRRSNRKSGTPMGVWIAMLAGVAFVFVIVFRASAKS